MHNELLESPAGETDRGQEILRQADLVDMEQLRVGASVQLSFLRDGVLPKNFNADAFCQYLARFRGGKLDSFQEDLDRYVSMGS